MNKRGQGGSELRVREVKAHDPATARIANYLRENLGVKEHMPSGQIRAGCIGKAENAKNEQPRVGKANFVLSR
jgi:hypothetical protein